MIQLIYTEPHGSPCAESFRCEVRVCISVCFALSRRAPQFIPYNTNVHYS